MSLTSATRTAFRGACRYDMTPGNRISGTEDDSRHDPGGEQLPLTTSEFSGRSRRTACPHHRRSEPSALPGVGEHFGRGDHFANLHPICSHLQGQVIQELLTAATCAHSPARGHRVSHFHRDGAGHGRCGRPVSR